MICTRMDLDPDEKPRTPLEDRPEDRILLAQLRAEQAQVTPPPAPPRPPVPRTPAYGELTRLGIAKKPKPAPEPEPEPRRRGRPAKKPKPPADLKSIQRPPSALDIALSAWVIKHERETGVQAIGTVKSVGKREKPPQPPEAAPAPPAALRSAAKYQAKLKAEPSKYFQPGELPRVLHKCGSPDRVAENLEYKRRIEQLKRAASDPANWTEMDRKAARG